MKITIKAMDPDASVAKKAVQTLAGEAAIHFDVAKLNVKEAKGGAIAYVYLKD